MVFRYNTGSSTSTGFPNQKLTPGQKKKEYGSLEKYGIAMINAVDELTAYNNSAPFGALENKLKISTNLDLVERGIFDHKLVVSLLDPLFDAVDAGVKKDFPEEPTHYDLITPKINLIKGEEISRPFNYVVYNQSSDNTSNMQEMRAKMIFDITTFMLTQELMKGQNPENPKINPQVVEEGLPKDQSGQNIDSFEKIDKYISYSYSDMTEKIANDLMKYLVKEVNLEYKFNQNFGKYLTTGCEVYYIGTEGNKPTVRIVNPLLFDCEASTESLFIEEAAWCREVRFLTTAEVYDAFWEDLTSEDVTELEKCKGNIFDVGFNTTPGYETLEAVAGKASFVRVARYEWQGLKKIGIITSINPETGEEVKDFVTDDYEKKDTDTLDWFWVNERWEGYRIGQNIYIGIKPIPNQYDDIDNMFKNSSSYVGTRDNYSFVDKIIPYQYLFNVLMHKIKIAVARDKGSGFIMDLAQIPKKKGDWSIEKWLHVLDTYGIAIINSLEQDESGQRSQFNQFQQIDRSTAGTILNYVNILQFILQSVADITGISKQREGQTTARETASGIERSVTQSVAITETFFYVHNEVKKRVLSRLIDVAKIAYKGSKKLNYILDDLGRQYIELTEDFKNTDFGVFVSNSAQDIKIIQMLKEVAQISLQQKEITLKDFVATMRSQSAAEIQRILLDAEKYNQQKQQEMQQSQMQMQQQAQQQQVELTSQIEQAKEQARAQSQLQIEQTKGDIQLQIAQLKSTTDLEIAKLNAEAKITSFRMDVDADANNNGILDVLEREKIAVEREKIRSGENMEKERNKLDKDLKDKDLEIKDKELAMKDKDLKLKDKELANKQQDQLNIREQAKIKPRD